MNINCSLNHTNAVSIVSQSSEAIDLAMRDVKLTLQLIMSFLDFQSVARCREVSWTWKSAVDDAPELWQSIIYRQFAFGNDKWAQCFGLDVIKDEPVGEDFASLPWREVIEGFRNIKKVFPERKATDCLMLVRLPKTLNGGLSINCLDALAKQHFPDNTYRHISDEVVEKLGNQSIKESYWVLMTKYVLPMSRSTIFYSPRQIIAYLTQQSFWGYRVPKALEAITCVLSQYFDSRIRLFNDAQWIYTPCLDGIIDYQLLGGGFIVTGLFVDFGYYVRGNVTVAALRKFT